MSNSNCVADRLNGILFSWTVVIFTFLKRDVLISSLHNRIHVFYRNKFSTNSNGVRRLHMCVKICCAFFNYCNEKIRKIPLMCLVLVYLEMVLNHRYSQQRSHMVPTTDCRLSAAENNDSHSWFMRACEWQETRRCSTKPKFWDPNQCSRLEI